MTGGGASGGPRAGATTTLRRLGKQAVALTNDPPAVAEVKNQLLLVAIEKSPRFRNDLDMVVITQFLLSLESLQGVSAQAIHYLATECSALTLRDGDVFCYQEDPVVDDSTALIVIEGSLCGYYNKSFSQRHDESEMFSSWNARQNRRRGVLIDFGEIQTTYTAGVLCGFDDLLVGVNSESTPHSGWYRRKGIHAQEETRTIAVSKDTLERAVGRFGLTLERGTLHSDRELTSTDISHLAICTALSDASRHQLLQGAHRRVWSSGETVYPFSSSMSTIQSFVLVLSGRLDIYWTGSLQWQHTTDEQTSTADTLSSVAPPERDSDAIRVFERTPLLSVRRGQSLGDQAIGLALEQLFHSASQASTPANRLPIRVVSGEDSTELLRISHSMYEEKLHEDHAVLSYAAHIARQRAICQSPTPAAATASQSLQSLAISWMPTFFSQTPERERSSHDLNQLMWRLTTDAVVGKTFIQFPPVVFERMCHAMRLYHHDSASVISFGVDCEEAANVYVVISGALRDPTQDDQFLPGDIVGLASMPSTALYADAGTMLITLPRVCVERWLQPVSKDIIANAGTLFFEHSAYVKAHPHRFSVAQEKRKSIAAMSRGASAQSSGTDDVDTNISPNDSPEAPHADALAHLLRRMGHLTFLPHCILRELLRHGAMIHKQPGETLFQENETTSALAIILSGFVRFFSLENMASTIDMFHNHSFCKFTSLHHLLAKSKSQLPQGEDEQAASDSTSPAASSSLRTRHRSAMFGVHIQTLHAGNAFRTGVLQDGTRCPATVVAHTHTVLLLFDDRVYTQLLKKHVPPIDLARYGLLHLQRESEGLAHVGHNLTLACGQRQFPASLPPAALTKYVEEHTKSATSLPWLANLSHGKCQLLLRSVRLLSLHPGDRLIRYHDVIDHAFIVVSGSLALYIPQHQDDVVSALDASQRSVRSLMLERNVTSNYSTTSHQLNYVSSPRGTDPRHLQHKRAILKNKVKNSLSSTTDAQEKLSDQTQSPSSSLFVHSVLAAVQEEKQKSLTSITPPSTQTDAQTPPPDVVDEPRARRRRQATTVTFHSAVSRATLQHRLDKRRGARVDGTAFFANSSQVDDEADEPDSVDTCHGRGSMLLCHLLPGDVYGEEALSNSAFRSQHDILADIVVDALAVGTSVSNSSATTVELLCIPREAYISVISKTDDEVEQELRGRSKVAKSKWHKAGQLVTQTRKGSTSAALQASQVVNKTPKLFDLFRNILNQRFYLTMRAIAEIPQLQDLAVPIKQELCAGARFEALERYANAYRDDSRHLVSQYDNDAEPNSRLRYYFVLSGRVGLFPKAAIQSGSATLVPVSGLASVSVSSGAGFYPGISGNMDQCLQEVAKGRGFGEFELLVPESSRHHLVAIALESTKLLSLPGELFIRHWPQVDELRRHISYLRTRVSFFQRLEIEKVSYLYHALTHESYYRGSKIVSQNQQVPKSEVILLKEGVCSLKTIITVQSHPDRDGLYEEASGQCRDTAKKQHSPGDDPRGYRKASTLVSSEEQTQTGPEKCIPSAPQQTFRVLTTIADVCAGHVFWLDGNVAPFTLQASSANVAVARIRVDKLKAILPRSHLGQLEEVSEALATLYRDQVTNARKTIVRLMNQKRKAELGQLQTGTFLPSLHFSLQAITRKAQLQALRNPSQVPPIVLPREGDHRGRGSNGVQAEQFSILSEQPAIPYSRVLASQPVNLDLMRPSPIQHNEITPTLGEGDAQPTQTRLFCSSSPMDLAYRKERQAERYELSDVVATPSTLLRGSFPDGLVLRRDQRLRQSSRIVDEQLGSYGQGASVNAGNKVDEAAKPEETRPLGTEHGSRVQLQVKLPTPAPRSARSRALVSTGSPPSSAETRSASQKDTKLFVVDYMGSPESCDGRDEADFVLDVRMMLHNEMQSPLSPLRSIRLESSQSKVHSLGKYYDVPGKASHRPEVEGALGAGLATPRIPPSKWSKQPSRPRRPSRQVPSSLSPSRTETTLLRKKGFLCVIRLPPDATGSGYIQDQFLRTVAHHQKRRFFVLHDDTLREYCEETPVDASLLPNKARRSWGVSRATLTDAPASGPGEMEVVLRHSFLFAPAPDAEVLLFTCNSLVEKKSWMHEIRTAAALGTPPPLVTLANQPEIGSPGSPRCKHHQSQAASVATRERSMEKWQSMLSLHTGRNAVVQGEEVLEVEYRIS